MTNAIQQGNLSQIPLPDGSVNHSANTKKLLSLLPFSAPHMRAMGKDKKSLSASNTSPFIPNLGINNNNSSES